MKKIRWLFRNNFFNWGIIELGNLIFEEISRGATTKDL